MIALDENTDPDFFYAVVTAALGTTSRHDFERLIGLYENGYRGKGRQQPSTATLSHGAKRPA